jgi:hypothetical protein
LLCIDKLHPLVVYADWLLLLLLLQDFAAAFSKLMELGVPFPAAA